jgi:alpha-tubulin suppressor-like RCC1 family protein
MTGLQGIQGDTGVQGQTGVQGVQGVQGVTALEIIQDTLDLPSFSSASRLAETADTPIYVVETSSRATKGTNFKQYMRAETIDGLNRIQPGLALPVDDSSSILVWGSNASGNLGVGDVISRSSPVTQGFSFLGISKGSSHALGLNESGFAWSWGLNSSGQLASGNLTSSSSPVSVVGGNVFVQVKASGDNSYALDYKGFSWSWGSASGGALGNNQVAANASSPVSVIGNKTFVSLAAGKATGGNFVLALDETNQVWSWGANSEGQLGDSSIVSKSSPVSVASTAFKKVVAGFASHALDKLGYAWSWGLNTSGEIGDGTAANKSSPVSVVGSKKFVDIASGDNHTLALDKFGRVWAWGKNDVGQLGDVTVSAKSSPVSVNLARIIQIGAYGSTSLAVDIDGRGWAWGSNTSGLIGNGAVTDISSPVSIITAVQLATRKVIPKKFASDIIPINPPQTSEPFVITKGFGGGSSAFTVVLDSQSYAWAWGSSNSSGQLGNDKVNPVSSPVSVQGGKQWRSVNVFSSNGNVVALDTNSYAWAWGSGNEGQLGNGSSANMSSPVSVLGGKQWSFLTVSKVSVNNIAAIDSLSYAWGWGDNNGGVLGIGNTSNQSSPVSVLGGRQFIAIDTYSGMTAAIDSLSYAWAWGNNGAGALGAGTTNPASSPISILGAKQWRKIYVININTCVALDSNSYAWAWGIGNAGQLGNGTLNTTSSPVSVLGGKQWIDLFPVRATTSSILGIDNLSYAWGWGSNVSGVIGDGSITSASSPVSVIGGYQWLTLVGNFLLESRVVALDKFSYAWAWGASALGNNTFNLASSPVSVVGGRQGLSLWSTGGSISYLRDSNSYAFGWGANAVNGY